MTNKNALKRDEKGRLVKGTPPGPGRTPGSISLLTDIKRKLKKVAEEDPDEYEALIDYYWKSPKMRQLLLTMIDGMPKQKNETEIDLKGSLVEFIDGKSKD